MVYQFLLHGVISIKDVTSYDKLDFINIAKVMVKVTQGISPIYITEMFQIKGCNSEDLMTALRFKQKFLNTNAYIKHV